MLVAAIPKSTWLNHARNAEVVLHRDAFKKSPNGSIPTNSTQDLLLPELNDDVVSEIRNKITGNSHFTFIRPGTVIDKAYPNESLKHHTLWARAIRALQISTIEKIGGQIEKEDPDFLGKDKEKYALGLLTFNPLNPIKPHSDFLDVNCISATSCLQKLQEGEEYSRSTIWNINPDDYPHLSTHDFTQDPVQGIFYINEEKIQSGEIESFELPRFTQEEGAIVFFADALVAHSASKQLSKEQRRIHIVDLTPMKSDFFNSKEHLNKLRTEKIKFQDGLDVDI